MRFAVGFFAVLGPLLAAAETWFPAADWQDKPDPVASPHAVKGGTLRMNGANPPKSFNAYIDNNAYSAMTFSLMYETLISTDSETLDFKPALARRWAVSEDGRTFTFELDARARWSDGVPVTAEDVKWTFDAVMAPTSETGPYKTVLGAFESPVLLDERTVRFEKKGSSPRDWRDLMSCGTFWILPRHAFQDKDFNRLELLEAPVGGAYQLARVNEQVETEFRRVSNWWRRDFPSCRYICNFDSILLRYYAENENAFEAFKKRAIDVYPVYTARIMAEETKSERFARNWILARRVRNNRPVGFQGFAMNLRRRPFDDVRVRRAMAKLIDRETMNRTMMYGAYFLQNSYFTDCYDADHPCTNPLDLYDIEGAAKLLAEAGFTRNEKTGLLERAGRPFAFTFLSRSATEDKFLALFSAALTRLGIQMTIDRRDFAEWMRRMDAFDFDMTWQSWGAGVFKTPEVMWLSSEADRRGSNNTIGFKSQEVDRLIAAEKGMMSAADRAEAYRAIDRLIVAEAPYAFLWNIDETRLLYWNKFGTPATILPKHADEEGVLTYWWYDADRAEELADAMAHGTCLPTVPRVVEYEAVQKSAADEGGMK